MIHKRDIRVATQLSETGPVSQRVFQHPYVINHSTIADQYRTWVQVCDRAELLVDQRSNTNGRSVLIVATVGTVHVYPLIT